jgi:hypothetical protein
MAQIREWVPVYPATGSQVHRLGVPLRRRPGCTPVRSGIPGAPRLHASQQQSPLLDQVRGDDTTTGFYVEPRWPFEIARRWRRR